MATKIPPHQPESRLCAVCPRRLQAGPTSPCPAALERIAAIQANPRADHDGIGCPWYILSKAHNYCFWNYIEDKQDKQHTDREIAELLGITVKQVRQIASDAIQKLQANKNSPDMQAFREAVQERAAADSDGTIFAPDQISDQAHETISFEAAEVEKKPGRKPKVTDKFQPTHRDGKKRDIYFAKKRDKNE